MYCRPASAVIVFRSRSILITRVIRDMFGDESPFSDFFEQFFGTQDAGAADVRSAGRVRSKRQERRQSGSDLEHPVEVSLADAYRGTTVQLAIEGADSGTRRLEVKIPPGVRNGSRVRVKGQGGAGRGGGAVRLDA